MKSRSLIILFFCSFSLHAQIASIGKINIHQALTWDYPETNVTFTIYGSLTNETNFVKIGNSSTNFWVSKPMIPALDGWRKIYITATSEDGGESDPGPTVMIEFKLGKPIPPSNYQIFTLIYGVATNALPQWYPEVSPPTPK